MWSDILKATQILVQYLTGDGLEKRKRRGFAKNLIRIYLDIDRLVGQGTWILSQLANRDRTQLTASDLIEQLKVIQSLIDDLNDSKVQAVIKIQLPALAQLDYYWLHIKWEFLQGLIIDLSALSMSCSPIGHPQLFGAKDSELPKEDELLLVQEIPEDQIGQHSNHWRKHKALLKQWFLSVARPNNEVMQTPMVVRASPEDVGTAREVLEAIAKQGEELRKFILDNFELNDIITST